MGSMQPHNPHLILPLGTQVVALTEVRRPDGTIEHPRGAAGEVVQAPADAWHSYRVRFTDGAEASFARRELAVLRHHIAGDLSANAAALQPLAEYRLFDHVIFRCVIGSRAYGLDHDASDTDRRGVYLPPAEAHWSLYGVPEQIDNPETQETYWEFQNSSCSRSRPTPTCSSASTRHWSSTRADWRESCSTCARLSVQDRLPDVQRLRPQPV